MPLYEYICRKCDLKKEVLCKCEERDKPQTCPKCLGRMELLLSAANLAFKGTGFYTTDYKTKT